MYCVQEIVPNIFWVGGNDRRLELFENMFPLPNGVSYNSYLIMDEKTALMDTVDSAISGLFLANITHVLDGRTLDYLVINHMEPDHCANIAEIVRRYPDVKIVGNARTFNMIQQFFHINPTENYYEVKEGDELCLGKHTLRFYFAPMVHWPEVMMAYEKSQKILFSADAFGTFGAHPGNLFADEVDFENLYMDDLRRYYANIVGKYGMQVQAVLKKLSGVEIQTICALHGPIWRKNLDVILSKHDVWSRYVPEKQGVLLAYASMYGNTQSVANRLANLLAQKGVTDMRMHDVSKTHPSYIIADAWKYSHMVLAAPTYNLGLYPVMDALLRDMAALHLQNRHVAIIGNGSWATASGKIMRNMVECMKNMTLIAEPFEITSAMRPDQQADLELLADQIAQSVLQSAHS